MVVVIRVGKGITLVVIWLVGSFFVAPTVGYFVAFVSVGVGILFILMVARLAK